MYTHSPFPEVALTSLSLSVGEASRSPWARTRLSNLLLENRVQTRQTEPHGTAIFTGQGHLSTGPRLTLPGRPCTQLQDGWGHLTSTAFFPKLPPPSLTVRRAPGKARLEDTPRDTRAGRFFRLSWLWTSRQDPQIAAGQRRQDSNTVPWTGPQNRKRTLMGRSAKQRLSPEYRS